MVLIARCKGRGKKAGPLIFGVGLLLAVFFIVVLLLEQMLVSVELKDEEGDV